ncbi:MAG: F-box-like [Parachlamydiales bacterium]|nr:F-box-like [Parachlamydiales bacterium]
MSVDWIANLDSKFADLEQQANNYQREAEETRRYFQVVYSDDYEYVNEYFCDKERINEGSFNKIPNEIAGEIFTFLPINSLGTSLRICKRWNDLAKRAIVEKVHHTITEIKTVSFSNVNFNIARNSLYLQKIRTNTLPLQKSEERQDLIVSGFAFETTLLVLILGTIILPSYVPCVGNADLVPWDFYP